MERLTAREVLLKDSKGFEEAGNSSIGQRIEKCMSGEEYELTESIVEQFRGKKGED